MRPGYRIWQLALHLWAGLRPGAADDPAALGVLIDGERALWHRMGRGDRAHALRVWRALRADPRLPREVAAAALLHDVGKAGSGLTLAHRAAIILLGALRPTWLVQLECSEAGWREPFSRQAHHAERGAVLCSAAGSHPTTVALVRWHGTLAPPELAPALLPWLAALQQADDAN